MRRMIRDVLLLVAASAAILLLFTVVVIVFGIPNTFGLDRSWLAQFGSSALGFAMRNKEAGAWSLLGLSFAILVGLRLIRRAPRAGREARLAAHNRATYTHSPQRLHGDLKRMDQVHH